MVVPGCAVAAWWQINRAQDGNQLSYLYSVMWPVFGLLAIIFWWMLIHTDYDTVGLKGMRRQQTRLTAVAVARSQWRGRLAGSHLPVPEVSLGSAADEDPELAAYNARLAELAAKGPKTWRHREAVVVRRAAVRLTERGLEGALFRYQLMANIVGVLIIPLFFFFFLHLAAPGASRSSSPSSASATATSTSST